MKEKKNILCEILAEGSGIISKSEEPEEITRFVFSTSDTSNLQGEKTNITKDDLIHCLNGIVSDAFNEAVGNNNILSKETVSRMSLFITIFNLFYEPNEKYYNVENRVKEEFYDIFKDKKTKNKG